MIITIANIMIMIGSNAQDPVTRKRPLCVMISMIGWW